MTVPCADVFAISATPLTFSSSTEATLAHASSSATLVFLWRHAFAPGARMPYMRNVRCQKNKDIRRT